MHLFQKRFSEARKRVTVEKALRKDVGNHDNPTEEGAESEVNPDKNPHDYRIIMIMTFCLPYQDIQENEKNNILF